jgi:hypothetical protein
MPLFDVMLTARGEHLTQTRVCSLLNREASALAEGLAPDESWPTDEPMPDLSLLWETSDAMRSRPRDPLADSLNRKYGMYGSARLYGRARR